MISNYSLLVSSIHSEFPEGRDFIYLSVTGAQVGSGRGGQCSLKIEWRSWASSGDLEV